jgi:hypothetical protein
MNVDEHSSIPPVTDDRNRFTESDWSRSPEFQVIKKFRYIGLGLTILTLFSVGILAYFQLSQPSRLSTASDYAESMDQNLSSKQDALTSDQASVTPDGQVSPADPAIIKNDIAAINSAQAIDDAAQKALFDTTNRDYDADWLILCMVILAGTAMFQVGEASGVSR